MKRRILIAVLALSGAAFGQSWTVAKCRSSFADRHRQLTAHFDSMTDSMSEQFDSPIGKTSTQDLLSWEQELEACVNRIDGERPLYSVVARQLNEVLNDRILKLPSSQAPANQRELVEGCPQRSSQGDQHDKHQYSSDRDYDYPEIVIGRYSALAAF